MIKHLLVSLIFVPVLVAGAIADINRKVSKGDSKNTLQALQLPSAGLRAVHPDCADIYQTKLAESQANDANKGNLNNCWHSRRPALSHMCSLGVIFILSALLQAAAIVFGLNTVSVIDISITTIWRQARVHGKSRRDSITEVTISVKRKSRSFSLCLITFTFDEQPSGFNF